MKGMEPRLKGGNIMNRTTHWFDTEFEAYAFCGNVRNDRRIVVWPTRKGNDWYVVLEDK